MQSTHFEGWLEAMQISNENALQLQTRLKPLEQAAAEERRQRSNSLSVLIGDNLGRHMHATAYILQILDFTGPLAIQSTLDILCH